MQQIPSPLIGRLVLNTRPARCRAGVSLMEVLISIAVILGGMLGVVSLLFVGSYEAAEAVRKDRAASVGRAARNEIQIRRWLDYNSVRWYDGSDWSTINANAFVAIDPRGCRANVGDKGAQGYRFPANLPPDSTGWALSDLPLRVNPLSGVGNSVLSREVADRIFTSDDELTLDMPEDKTVRPRHLFRKSDGKSASSPITDAEVFISEGNYSWLATLCPVPSETGSTRRTYEVSIVVFNGRVLTADQEPACNVVGLGTGTLIGGGDIQLKGDAAANVKPGQWIMLLAKSPDAYKQACKWYRIVAAGEMDASNQQRRVTLAGPDWQADWASDTNTYATIFPGVVGVYTQTMELD